MAVVVFASFRRIASFAPLPILGAHPTAIGIRGPLRIGIVPPALARMFGGFSSLRASAVSGCGAETRAGESAKERRQSYDCECVRRSHRLFSRFVVSGFLVLRRFLGRKQCAVHGLQLNLGNIRAQASDHLCGDRQDCREIGGCRERFVARVDGYFLHNDSLFMIPSSWSAREQRRCQLKRAVTFTTYVEPTDFSRG
jgi:hypothetical protein